MAGGSSDRQIGVRNASFTALVATCAYVGALMFVSLASVNLKKKINDLREEKSP